MASAHDYDGFVLVNLCPVRASDCRTLPATVEPGLVKANLEAIGRVAASVQDLVLWAAWGAPVLTRPFLVSAAVVITACVERFRPGWRHFGPRTMGGYPRHPSRLSYAWAFAPFDVADYLERVRLAKSKGAEAPGPHRALPSSRSVSFLYTVGRAPGAGNER